MRREGERKTMDLFSRFVPTLGFGVFRFVFGSLDLWAYTPKSPIPSLLSLLPSKMKYCRRLWISERRQGPSLPLSTQNDKYAARSSSEKFPAAIRLTD